LEVRIHDLIPVLSSEEGRAFEQQSQQRQQRQQTLIDSRRAFVLDAARTVFAEKGADGASIREIAKRAGYTPGAIYSYFDSKEAVYAALLQESIDRLEAAISTAPELRGRPPPRALAVRAQAWFGFYAQNPRDLELAFYLLQGAPQGGTASPTGIQLAERLRKALQPCEEALQAMGLSDLAAVRENAALFAHGMGLLLLARTGGAALSGQSPQSLFQDYLDQLTARLDPGEGPNSKAQGQADLFGH